ncbi:MAG: hypothetical protein ACI8S6_004669 [Myxococcota bacterium]|jgi:hypothetical protein
MELRPLLVLGALLALLAGNAYLITTEEITRSEEQSADQLKRRDALRDLVYAKSSREANFKAFGMDAAMTKRAMDLIADYEGEYGTKLGVLLREAGEPMELGDALCGSTDQVRPRYGALEFLAEANGERRRPIDLRQASGLERQEWALASPISRVFEIAELSDERQPDATIMAMAAIIEGKEEILIERKRPWGRPIVPGGWSWSKVKAEHPGVDQQVARYLAMMHLTVEIAQSSGGICGD